MTPLAEYAPDRAPYAPNASDAILNARPVADGWGPLPSLATFSDALAADPKGIFTARAPDSTTVTIAFTTTKAYTLGSSGTWTDVSGGATYTLPDGDRWSYDLFGDRIIATNISDGAYYWVVGTGPTLATLPGSPPKAKYVRTVGEFVVLGNLENTPNAVAWSGINDTEEWTSGVKLADTQIFKRGGPVHGVLDVSGGAVVFQRDLIRTMQRAPGSGYTFRFVVSNEKRGVLAPNSITKIGSNDFVYLTSEGFFRGMNTAIGAERVDEWFFATADDTYITEVQGAPDPEQKIVWFTFRTQDSTYRMLGYDWQLDRWFVSDEDAYVLADVAPSGTTLEDLDALYGTLEDVPVSLDSAQFRTSTRPAFAGFERTTNKLGYFSGSAQAAVLETATVQGGRNRSFCRGVELVGDLGTRDMSSNATFTMQIGKQDYHDEELTWTATVEPEARTGIVPFRADARLHRYRVNTLAGASWTTISGVKPRLVETGDA